jgi:hypothetical protein
MDRLIREVADRAERELATLRERADREGWDVERCEREKGAVALRFDVTLCTTPGCMRVASAVPGFDDLDVRCPSCASPTSKTM